MKAFLLGLLKPKAGLAKALILCLFIGIAYLAYVGDLKPYIDLLSSEQFSYRLGDTQISAFLLLKSILTVSVGLWLAGWLSDYIESHIKNIENLRLRSRIIIIKFLQILVYFVLFLLMLDIIGIDLTALGILGGAIGIGIGFGLQKITSNFISGMILLFENSIEINDLVELSDGLFGFVRHTGARFTLIETFEGREVMVPNEDFVTNRVTNWTFTNTSGRIDVRVGVSYDSDLDLVMKTLLECADNHPLSLDEPKPACFIEEFADSSVNFVLYFWIGDVTAGRMGPRSEVMHAIWNAFKENNVTIPFPQRDVHLFQPGKTGGNE